MSRLDEIIVFTPDLDRMRDWYQERLGLRVREELADWVQFETAGIHLGLHATWQGHERETALVFEVPDLDAAVAAVRRRRIEVTVESKPELYDRLAWFRDPEGNLVDLHPPGARKFGDGGPPIPRLLLNCRDFGGMVAFYREALGLPVIEQAPGWAELDAGGPRLALHASQPGHDGPLHAGQKIVFDFERSDLEAWVEELHRRGVAFATALTEEDYGTYAEARDPDGNVVLFRRPPDTRTEEEKLAEPWDDDDTPRQDAMRKPVKKGAKAVSRVAVKPEYHVQSVPARRRPSATTQAVVKVRGGGPDRTRATPKRTADEKKARGKLAIGRAKKATVANMGRKRGSAAAASKGKPVKRQATRRSTSRSTGRAGARRK
jgi:catechol 2,3-dioxygenase-like lactoylglutathione lyase family enzyme